jgi:hypothetical protein
MHCSLDIELCKSHLSGTMRLENRGGGLDRWAGTPDPMSFPAVSLM